MKLYVLFAGAMIMLYGCKQNNNKAVVHPFDKAVEDNNAPAVNKNKLGVESLVWLEGSWIDSTSFPGNKIVEVWKKDANGWTGKRGTIKQGDTLFGQTSVILEQEGKIVYKLESKGHPLVVFKLKRITNNEVFFENKANTAPRSILYASENGNFLQELKIITPMGERTVKGRFTGL